MIEPEVPVTVVPKPDPTGVSWQDPPSTTQKYSYAFASATTLHDMSNVTLDEAGDPAAAARPAGGPGAVRHVAQLAEENDSGGDVPPTPPTLLTLCTVIEYC